MKDKINNIDEALLLEDEIIVRYLKGKMTTDEEEKFMQEVNSNDELKSKAVAIARMVKGMKEVGAASDKEVVDEFLAIDSDEIKTLAKNTSATNKKGKIMSLRRTATWLSAAASVALLICGGFTYLDYRKTTALGNEYSTVFSSSPLI